MSHIGPLRIKERLRFFVDIFLTNKNRFFECRNIGNCKVQNNKNKIIWIVMYKVVEVPYKRISIIITLSFLLIYYYHYLFFPY